MIPGLAGMTRWLDWIADNGFDGVVIEYEDRLPWKVLPDLYRQHLTMDDWRVFWTHCRGRGLQVIPLMQVQGHLEWMLKHTNYSHLRENQQWNEVCPNHPETLPLMQAWMDELLCFHPESEIVHLGGDETWNLATCSRCRERAVHSGIGPMAIYYDHVGELCRQVVARGKRPMIWADMFWRSEKWISGRLPSETILVDWQYGGSGPWPSLEKTSSLGLEVWGGSAIRSGFDAKYALAPLGMRVENIIAWKNLQARGKIDHILHTVWGRSNSLHPIYGPWEGWLPAFMVAADVKAWQAHPLNKLSAQMDQAMIAPEWSDLGPLIGQLESAKFNDAMLDDCLSWWVLALAHRRLLHHAVDAVIRHPAYDAVARFRGISPDSLDCRANDKSRARDEALEWKETCDHWLKKRGYSDSSEYLATKLDGVLRCLE